MVGREPSARNGKGFVQNRSKGGEVPHTQKSGEAALNFLCSGSSALFLLIANLFPDFWYLSFFALTPFLFRMSRVSSRAAFRLGFLFGFFFLFIWKLDALLLAPLSTAAQITAGTAGFAIFGWAAVRFQEKFGFNPFLVALLWSAFQAGLFKLGLSIGFFETPPLGASSAFLRGLSVLFGFLFVAFLVVFFNSLIVAAVEKIVSLAKTWGRCVWEIERIWHFSSIPGLSAQKVYLVPEGRAPPFSAFVLTR